jgi:glycosyltransferase involved in cell wall biosynthesis
LKVAYLVNQYPQPSQSFIRREIVALEARGLSILRFTLRRWDGVLVDPRDQAERDRTRAVLDEGAFKLVGALMATLAARPTAFARAAWLALRLGWRSDRGPIVHAIYLAEACVLARWTRAERVDHVHAHFGTNSTTVAMLCEALGGPPYSFTAHGPEEFDKPQVLALGEKIRRSVFTVAISDFGRSQLFRWAPVDAWPKVQVVRCGLDALFLDGSPKPPPANRRLVCVGRLAEQKGQLILIEAASLMAARGIAFEIVVIGDGPFREPMERRIRELGLGGNVRLIGWQSNSSVRTWIIESRAMVLPSFAEGLPVALMEALALGRPAISTYVAGIPELVEPGVCGWLVPPASVESLARAMAEALEAADETIVRMGRAGAERVAKLHNAISQAEILERLFRNGGRSVSRSHGDHESATIGREETPWPHSLPAPEGSAMEGRVPVATEPIGAARVPTATVPGDVS